MSLLRMRALFNRSSHSATFLQGSAANTCAIRGPKKKKFVGVVLPDNPDIYNIFKEGKD